MSTHEQDREALARVLYEADKWNKSWDESSDAMKRGYRSSADNLMAMGYRLTVPAPAPKREWPVTDEAVHAYVTTPGSVREGLRAAAPHLWRARVEGMTDEELYRVCHWKYPDEVRTALIALGDL